MNPPRDRDAVNTTMIEINCAFNEGFVIRSWRAQAERCSLLSSLRKNSLKKKIYSDILSTTDIHPVLLCYTVALCLRPATVVIAICCFAQITRVVSSNTTTLQQGRNFFPFIWPSESNALQSVHRSRENLVKVQR